MEPLTLIRRMSMIRLWLLSILRIKSWKKIFRS